jgi:hypothetical protein
VLKYNYNALSPGNPAARTSQHFVCSASLEVRRSTLYSLENDEEKQEVREEQKGSVCFPNSGLSKHEIGVTPSLTDRDV